MQLNPLPHSLEDEQKTRETELPWNVSVSAAGIPAAHREVAQVAVRERRAARLCCSVRLAPRLMRNVADASSSLTHYSLAPKA